MEPFEIFLFSSGLAILALDIIISQLYFFLFLSISVTIIYQLFITELTLQLFHC